MGFGFAAQRFGEVTVGVVVDPAGFFGGGVSHRGAPPFFGGGYGFTPGVCVGGGPARGEENWFLGARSALQGGLYHTGWGSAGLVGWGVVGFAEWAGGVGVVFTPGQLYQIN